jgi:hypothetical protein
VKVTAAARHRTSPRGTSQLLRIGNINAHRAAGTPLVALVPVTIFDRYNITSTDDLREAMDRVSRDMK